ncbi:hypothetical protein KQ940_22525 [Marinobacterium sp. D7]|uniref:hypothetical protein n=1 Tax=Marinobacterium ramblicola TaxID=2849041 RepID=UPI001C2D505C|nr:hypothetical protein [Marinobacterium ramblicola]MBV1790847.1 hypothetical protein [Marinobacterium ramblicola]
MTIPKIIKKLLGIHVTGYPVNRGVLRLHPKQPFIEWLAKESQCSLEEAERLAWEDRTAFLLPMSWDIKPEKEVVGAVYRYLFETTLQEWVLDKRRWPHPRSRQLFNQWFDIHWSDKTIDLSREPLASDPEPYEPM